MLLGCNHALNILHFKDGTKRVCSVQLLLQIYKEFFLLNQALDIGGSLEEAIDLLNWNQVSIRNPQHLIVL